MEISDVDLRLSLGGPFAVPRGNGDSGASKSLANARSVEDDAVMDEIGRSGDEEGCRGTENACYREMKQQQSRNQIGMMINPSETPQPEQDPCDFLDALGKLMVEERQRLQTLKCDFPICMLLLDSAITTTSKILHKQRRNPSDDGKTELGHRQAQHAKSSSHAEKISNDPASMVNAYACSSSSNTTRSMGFKRTSQPQMNQIRRVAIADSESQSCCMMDSRLQDCTDNNSNDDFYESARDDQASIDSHAVQRSMSSNNIHGKMISRKIRRWWSTELHKKFMRSVPELGGPRMATPNHIRQVMDIEGLTNQEVKSHLQKSEENH